MKELILSASIIGITFAICSCNSTDAITEWEEDSVKNICFTIEPIEFEDGFSRLESNLDDNLGVIFAWEANDTVGIFPTTGGQVEFPITTTGIGSTEAIFSGGGWALRMNHTYHAYYPFHHSNRRVNNVPFSYMGQEYDGTISDEWGHLGDYIFMIAPPAQSTSGNVEFSLKHQGNILIAYLTLPVATTYTAMTVYAEANVFPVKKSFNLMTGTEIATEYSDHLTLKLNNITTQEENEEVILGIVMPSCQSTYPLKVAVYDKKGNAYTAQFTKLDGTTPANASFSAGAAQKRKASPKFEQNFTTGIEDWMTSVEIEGTAPQV